MTDRQYYIGVNGSPQGPFDLEGLKARSLQGDTLVWYQGLGSWVRADSLDELAGLYMPVMSAPVPAQEPEPAPAPEPAPEPAPAPAPTTAPEPEPESETRLAETPAVPEPDPIPEPETRLVENPVPPEPAQPVIPEPEPSQVMPPPPAYNDPRYDDAAYRTQNRQRPRGAQSDPDYEYEMLNPSLSWAIAGLVVSLIGCWWAAFFTGIPALVCSIIARNKIASRSNLVLCRILCNVARWGGLAGIIIGGIGLFIFSIMLLAFL